MAEEWIECPKCGAKVPLTKALTGPIEARLRASIEKHVKEESANVAKREEAVRARESRLAKTVETEVKARLPKELERVRSEVSEEFESTVKELREKVGRTTKRAEQAEAAERELRAGQEGLENRAKSLDLEVARKVADETKSIQAKIQSQTADALKLKDQEHSLQIQGLNERVEELQQKLAQGSEQRQGEALEAQMEDELRRTFPSDQIEPVPTGTRGADIIQRVRTVSGQACGVIVWETKRTKDWHDDWIVKLKEDTNRLQGDASILVSRALPEGVRTFSFDRGVVVTHYGSALPVAVLVRLRLLEVARQKRVGETSTDTREQLYQYLTSREFVARVESIVSPLAAMRADLDSEIRAIEGRWRKRRKELDKAEKSIVGIYGDLQGIVGRAKLPEVAPMALPEPISPGDSDPVEQSEPEK